ncbi:MAG TPA: cupin domain-containing protein [Myxococcota bacterium]|nr:cupin domain-containing protein [Myxococcota bacterium]
MHTISRRAALAGLWVAALLVGTACGRACEGPAPAIDALLGGSRVSIPLTELSARVPLADGQDFRVEELGRSESTSHHVASIRTAEPLHRHDSHDLLVVLVRGHGTQRVGDETRPVGEGSVIFVPRGVPHAFTNAGPEPAIAYVVYAPPFDGKDRVPVE